MARMGKRFAAGVLSACLVAWGGGCVVVNVGEPVSFSRETRREFVNVSTRDELMAVAPETKQSPETYSRLTVRLHRKILTTTSMETNAAIGRLTLTSQKRMAVGLFPGAAMYLFPTKGPEGADMLGPYEGSKQTSWRGITWPGYAAYVVFPLFHLVSTPYTLLAAPFTPWTVWGRYNPSTEAELRRFSRKELLECGIKDDSDDQWDASFQSGLLGTVKYPDAFIKREEYGRKNLKGAMTSEVHSWALSGPFEVDLEIPEVGFHGRQTTAKTYATYYDDKVEFVLPSDPRAEDLVEDGTGTGADGAKARRKYRARLSFRPLGPRDDEKEAWSWAAGKVFEADVHLEKGPAYLGGGERRVQEVVTEVHHYHETRVVEVRKPPEAAWDLKTVQRFPDGRAEYLVTILDGSKTPFDVEREAKPLIEENLRAAFAWSMPGMDPRRVQACVVAEYEGRNIRFKGVAFSVQRMAFSWHYDGNTQRGRVRLRISEGMAPDEAKRWARENIKAIVEEKNIALEAGSPPPPGAKYRSLDETLEDGVLTVEFEAVE